MTILMSQTLSLPTIRSPRGLNHSASVYSLGIHAINSFVKKNSKLEYLDVFYAKVYLFQNKS